MTRAIRPAVAVLLAVLLVAAGCPGGDDRDRDATGTDWESCPDVAAEAVGDLVPRNFLNQLTEGKTYECATITVPRDWSDPDGATIELSLMRVRADNQRNRIGSLVVNPGGPGASGIDLAVFLSFGDRFGGLSTEITERFDIVGFDPRGVERSSPVECLSDEDVDASFAAEPDPVDREQFEAMLSELQRTAKRCGDKYGDTLRLYSTHQAARDLDAIRAAVGDEKLTYLGFSYGTLLGAVYAQLHPDRVRAMVLDGAVDATADAVEAARHQAEGFERAFDNFADWCARAGAQCPLGDDPRAAVTAALDQARTSPVAGEDGRRATAGWVMYAVIAALYSENTWPVLGAAIDQLDEGDPSGVFDLVDTYADRSPDGTYSNMWDAYQVITCADEAPEVTVEQARELQEQWRKEMPLFGASVALGTLSCYGWPVEPDPYPTGPAKGAPPILVVGTTGDPATPYESAGRLADMLGVGVVLTWEGEGHTAYPSSPCVKDTVNAYLIDLTVPESGKTCS
ncbi:MAG: alpha/beta hydrolase [Micromonosporaceae bacterium]